MNTPSEMTKAQLFKWAAKTATSAGSYMSRGGHMNTPRAWELIDRYALLKDEMLGRGVWHEYCNVQGWCPTHNEYDNFA